MNDTGQMSIDYIIGVSIFIFAFFFLYSILDSLFLPIQRNSDEVQIMAERASSNLVESASMLAIDSSNRNIISSTKAGQINDNLNEPQKYQEQLSKMGLTSTYLNYSLNISLRYFNDTLYPDTFTPLLIGGSIPDDSTKIGQTVRFVCLPKDTSNDCEGLKLVVRVWL